MSVMDTNIDAHTLAGGLRIRKHRAMARIAGLVFLEKTLGYLKTPTIVNSFSDAFTVKSKFNYSWRLEGVDPSL